MEEKKLRIAADEFSDKRRKLSDDTECTMYSSEGTNEPFVWTEDALESCYLNMTCNMTANDKNLLLLSLQHI